MKFRRRTRQSGYVLLVLMFFMSLLIFLALASAPRVGQEIRREREQEMIHRGVQYSRAIKKYFRKFGRYPATIEQLENTNNIRFLRKAYKDPMNPDGKWRLLRPGDVKLANAPNVGTPVSSMGSSMGGFGTSTTPGTQQQPSVTSPGGISQGRGALGSSGTFGSQGTVTGGQAGGVLGGVIGGTIIGVASTSEKEGIHEFNNKKTYKDWYFIYDPTTDRGGLITGPYSGKTFAGTAGSVVGMPGVAGPGTPMGQQPGLFGQPSSLGQGGFGQPAPTPQTPQRPPQ